MSFIFDGTNDRLTGTFTSTYNAYPCTLAAFIKLTTHPVAQRAVLQFGNSASSNNSSHSLHTGTTDDTYQAGSRDTGGSLGNATTGAVNFDGVWVGFVGVFTSTSLRDGYIGALANTGQNTSSRTVSNVMQFIRLGEWFSAAQDLQGRIAEAAIWNVALSAPQIAAYLAGYSADLISPTRPIGFWPMRTNTLANLGSDAGGTLSAAQQAAFDADHPNIFTRVPQLGLIVPSQGINRAAHF